MVAQKRKRPMQSGNESDSSGYSIVQASVSDEEVDISSALTGKKSRNTGKQREIDLVHSDEDLHEILQASIAKRNVKGGTEVLKKSKGKARMTKGEVGGGSFQSMGMYIPIYLYKMGTGPCTIFPRPSPFAFTFLDSAGLSGTHTHSTPFHPCSAIKSPS
jgi:hypothetical protein